MGKLEKKEQLKHNFSDHKKVKADKKTEKGAL
jgi:hypothetical protein